MYLGIDVGTQSVKLLCFDSQSQQVVARTRAPLVLYNRDNRTREQTGPGGEPVQRSGRREWCENLINQYL